jgi:dihydroneopterin aldolase
MEDSEKITLKNMTFSAFVGAAEWERDVRTRIEVDLELYADLEKACTSDSLDDTIDYASVYDLVSEVINGKHHNLLESVAEEIADTVFDSCKCDKVVVRIRKPHPPLGGPCDHAEIEIVRHKGKRR